jgi:ABC-type molybdate transport system substrate-binding protein
MCAAASLGTQAQVDHELRVYAAGSLRAALTEVAQAFERAEPGVRVQFTFGASGLLKDRIAAGERADVFASANMEHPQSLTSAGLAGPVQRFTRNAMCALVAPTVDAATATFKVTLEVNDPKGDLKPGAGEVKPTCSFFLQCWRSNGTK